MSLAITEAELYISPPLASCRGSLQYRRASGEHVDGKISAKPGHCGACIIWRALFIHTTRSGQRMAFVQYLSGYAVSPADQRNRRIPLVRLKVDCKGYLSGGN
ncbi:D-alanyl-D-alanine carboxypeptidase [Salmonella enterica subsp. enterica]|nr:D-alanyl-D-alanine carboxypeptidase [Salmonella enterica subsp. enterica]